MSRKLSALLVFAFLIVCSVRSADSFTQSQFQEDWRWIKYTTESGLPSNRITSLLTGADSSLWAAADNGVARFNGFQWVEISRGDSLADKKITIIKADQNGDLLAVADQRLYRVTQQQIRRIHLDDTTDSLRVSDIEVLGDDDYLISANRLLFRWRKNALARFNTPDTIHPVRPPFWRLLQGRDASIWAYSFCGLFELNRESMRWERHLEFEIHWLEAFADGQILAATYESAKTFNRGIWNWRRGQKPNLNSLGELGIARAASSRRDGSGVLVDGYGSLWLMDRNGHSVPDININGRIGLPTCLHFDSNDDLWIGSPTGLYLFKSSSHRWRNLRPGTSPLHQQINALCLSSDGDTWAATAKGMFVARPDGQVDFIDTLADVRLDIMTGVVEDRRRDIWICSGASPIGALRLSDSGWERFDSSDGLIAARIHRIVNDRSGRLWFLGLADFHGSRGVPGAVIYDGERFELWGQDGPLQGCFIYDFAEDSQGRRWFATNDGLHRWSKEGWQSWGVEDGLPRHRVFTVAIAQDDRPYFAFQRLNSGLLTIDSSGSLRTFTVADGLPDNSIWSVVADSEGCLWIATANGLGFRTTSGSFAAIGAADGLSHPHIWPILPLDDRVLLGSSGGGIFELSREEEANPAPVVTIPLPAIRQKSAFCSWHPEAYRGAIPSAEVLTRYRLNQGPWSRWSTTREAFLHGLAPGDHSFEVETKGLFGQTNLQKASRVFRIEPPFYLTPLFQLSAGFWSLSLLVLGIVFWRKRQRSLQLIRESEERLTRVTESLDDIVFRYRIHPAPACEFVNSAVAEITGYQEQDFYADPSFFTSIIHPDDRQAFENVVRTARQPGSTANLRIRRADDITIWTELRYVPILDSSGRLVAVEGILRDVSARREAEEVRENLIAELEAKTAELERFTYTVSHDLKSPLITIKGFVGMLERDTVEGRPDRVADDLARIRDAATKMHQLLDDLLELSRIGRIINEPSELPLADIVNEALVLVAGRIEERGIQIEVESQLPNVFGDRLRLLEVLQNLIDNASKFMGGQANPRIAIGAEQHEGVTVVYVSDNGIGVEPRYHEKIFGLFETLDPKGGGTGIGLALCKRIVEVHGGRIWVESEGAEQGASFKFSLPKGQPAS